MWDYKAPGGVGGPMKTLTFSEEELLELIHGLDSIDGGATCDATWSAEKKIQKALDELGGAR